MDTSGRALRGTGERRALGRWAHLTGPEHQPVFLCIGDSNVTALLQQQLAGYLGEGAVIETAGSGEAAVVWLEELGSDRARVAAVLAAADAPGMGGSAVLTHVAREWPHICRVVLLREPSAAAVSAAIEVARIQHVLRMPWHEPELHLLVESVLRQFRLSQENARLVETLSAKNQALLAMNRELEAKVYARTHELADANARLAQLAVTDGLTSLYNHRYFQERLVQECERTQRTSAPVSLLMIDVDNFKHYNDAHGHPAGDELLRHLSRVLLDGRRAIDMVARYGGEEFCVLLVDAPKFTAAKLADRLRTRIAEERFVKGETQPLGRVTVSIGVATLPDDAATADALVAAADAALYTAKRTGRNRVVLAGTVP